MDKLKMHSLDGVARNIKMIGNLFPNAMTEILRDGKVERAIDFDVLRQELSGSIVEGREERYQFTWPDKKKAMLAANAPITATLRPVVADSVGRDGTPGGFDSENLYIEGDNLEVLKLLQETYLGKVKMIYIDPPYNTGNDFVYEDDFAMQNDEFIMHNYGYDEAGNRMFKNMDTNGRFHTDWLNMIYPRLRLAKDLLTEDGVIFISIDDNEMENISKVCDEIFGEQNVVGTILWKKKTNGNNMGFLPPVHDYILCYAKNLNSITEMGYPVTQEFIAKTFSNPDNDPRGPWTTTDLSANHKGPYFAIENPKTGEIHYPPKGRYWVFNEKEVLRRIADGRVIFGKSGTGKPVQKVFAANRKFERIRADSWWDNNGMNEDATKELNELFGEAKLFTHPKPSKLLYHICKICTQSNDIVLDFFSGSATTAHAVMQLNAEDGGHRKFILVQLPEACDEKSEAYKAGYKNICEIGKERIRRAGAKIIHNSQFTMQNEGDENEQLCIHNSELCIGIDIGFRCLRLDSSNMQQVYYTPDAIGQRDLFSLVDNVRPDRTPEDLLFQVMLDLGVLLSSPITIHNYEFIIHNCKRCCRYYDVADGFLIACFDKDITNEVVTEIAKRKPYYAVFRDSSMSTDSVATNFDQIFETYSPDTVRKVI